MGELGVDVVRGRNKGLPGESPVVGGMVGDDGHYGRVRGAVQVVERHSRDLRDGGVDVEEGQHSKDLGQIQEEYTGQRRMKKEMMDPMSPLSERARRRYLLPLGRNITRVTAVARVLTAVTSITSIVHNLLFDNLVISEFHKLFHDP